MEKLLHERLREHNNVGDFQCGDTKILTLFDDEAQALADEIERCYIPRPRFEDGEPVQFGDEVELHYKSGGCEKGRMQSFHPNSGPAWILSFVGCGHERLYRYDSEEDVLKRPAPKVLDADGVELKVGDTTYSAQGGKKRQTIKSVHRAGEKNQSGAVINLPFVTYVDGGWDYASGITHREPDSLEQLRDALVDIAVRYREDVLSLCDEVNDCADRLTALIERGA